MANELTHTEAENVHETHATHFQLAGSDKEVILAAGEVQIGFSGGGQASTEEIVYDTKIRMDHQTAVELRDMLNESIDVDGEAATDHSGRGVQ